MGFGVGFKNRGNSVMALTCANRRSGKKPPMPAVDGTDHYWNYNVNVYPQNLTSEAPTKKIEDGDGKTLASGDQITWTVTALIPSAEVTSAKIYDQLDSSLKFVETTEIKVDGTTVTGNVTGPAANDTGANTWVFDAPDGLALINGNLGKLVTITSATEVTASIPSGTVDNKPGTPNNGYGAQWNGVPT